MKLYHGSNQVVDKPLVLNPIHTLDFGDGFYTTTNLKQAREWSKRTVRRRGGEQIVSYYDLPEDVLVGYSVREFNSPDGEWLDFVVANRAGNYDGEVFDLLIGPVADDTVYRVVTLYERGEISREAALIELKVNDLYNQYVFCNEELLNKLGFEKSEVYNG